MKILKFGAEGHTDTIFLHGFPSIRSQQNRVFAETHVERSPERSVDLLLYAGLGFAEGTFSFQECREGVRKHLHEVLSKSDKKIDLVGHSWGGLLACASALDFPGRVRRMVLMSPLVKTFIEEIARESFAETARDRPEIKVHEPERLARELKELLKEYSPERLGEAGQRVETTLFLQSREDFITPRDAAEEVLRFFPKASTIYEVVDTDHSFLVDRKRLTLRVADFLA